jgi:hypothetical protein
MCCRNFLLGLMLAATETVLIQITVRLYNCSGYKIHSAQLVHVLRHGLLWEGLNWKMFAG